jgi:hypothetical protein
VLVFVVVGATVASRVVMLPLTGGFGLTVNAVVVATVPLAAAVGTVEDVLVR